MIRTAARALAPAVLLSLVVAASTPRSASAVEAPTPLDLSKRLRAIGSFEPCTVEALRHGYQHPQDRSLSFEQAALCLQLADRFADARRLMLQLDAPPLDGHGRFRLCVSEVFLDGADPAPECARPPPPSDDDRFAAIVSTDLPRMRALHAGAWERAEALAPSAPALELSLAGPSGEREWLAEDRAFLQRHRTLRTRSPWLAAALSTVVPGLGRVYTGRWEDGLMSLLLVGIPVALAAQGFHADGVSSVRGWILGALGGALYAGNVYGSAVGAVRFNEDQEAALRRDIDRAYRARLEP